MEPITAVHTFHTKTKYKNKNKKLNLILFYETMKNKPFSSARPIEFMGRLMPMDTNKKKVQIWASLGLLFVFLSYFG